jgi:amino acid permease
MPALPRRVSSDPTGRVRADRSWNEGDPLDGIRPAAQVGAGKFFTATASLVNTAIGAGILSIPATFKGTGVVVGVLLIIISAMLCYLSSILLVNLTSRDGRTRLRDVAVDEVEVEDEEVETKGDALQQIANKYFGSVGFVIASICLTLLLFCAVASYEMILTAKVMDWLSLMSLDLTPIWARLLVCLLACAPGIVMSLLPEKFQKAGENVKVGLTVVSIGGFVLGMIGKSASEISPNGVSPTAKYADFDLSGLFLAFATHITAVAIPVSQTGALNAFTPQQTPRHRALLLAYVCSVLIIVLPTSLVYLALGDKVQSDALSSYAKDDTIVILIQIAIYAKVTCSLFGVFAAALMKYVEGMVCEVSPTRWPKLELPLKVVMHCALVAVTVFSTNLISVLSIGGALGGCLCMFSLPSLCLLCGPHNLTFLGKAFHGFIVAFGVFSAGISAFFGIRLYIREVTGSG